MSETEKPKEEPLKETPYATLYYFRKTDEKGMANDCDLQFALCKEAVEKGKEHMQQVGVEMLILYAVVYCREHKDGFEAGVDELAASLKDIYLRANEEVNVSAT